MAQSADPAEISDPAALRAVRFPRGTTLRAIWALLMREVATSYGQAFGGVVWAFLQPTLAILFLTAIFSAGFRSPPVGDNFAIFYASGMMPFMFYLSLSSQLGMAVRANARLLAYPRVTLIDALLARMIFATLIQLLVTVALYTLILLIWDPKVHLQFGPIATGLAVTALFGAGVGSVHAYIFVMFPTYRQIWSIVTQPLFLLSCILFSYEQVPAPFDDWLWYNPLIHPVATSRSGFYPGYNDHHVDLLYPIGLGLGLLVLGLILLNQGRGRILSRMRP